MNHDLYTAFCQNPTAYWFWFAVTSWVGCCMGSFLNVCIWRMPLGESVITAPSHCPKCNHQIRWYENIPLFSFLALRAKCSECRQPITWRYFIVELLTGILFAAAYFSLTYNRIYFAGIIPAGALIMMAVAGAFIDAEHRIIPDALTFPAMIIGLIFYTVEFFLGAVSLKYLIATIIFGLVVWGFFLLMSVIGKKLFKVDVLGLGDVKFMAATAFLMGAGLIGVFFSGLLIASLGGFLWGVFSALKNKKSIRRATLPFGPFLSFGMVAVLYIPWNFLYNFFFLQR